VATWGSFSGASADSYHLLGEWARAMDYMSVSPQISSRNNREQEIKATQKHMPSIIGRQRIPKLQNHGKQSKQNLQVRDLAHLCLTTYHLQGSAVR